MHKIIVALGLFGALAGPAQARTVKIEVTEQGFEPAQVQVRTGESLQLVFTRTTDTTCATEVKIPGLKVPLRKLPLNKPVAIEVHPNRPGSYTFACGMDMIKGKLLVK